MPAPPRALPARAAPAHDFIAAQPDGYQTTIGERCAVVGWKIGEDGRKPVQLLDQRLRRREKRFLNVDRRDRLPRLQPNDPLSVLIL